MSYNSFAYHYDKMMADVDYSWWIDVIEKNVKKGDRILDVGCGTGTLSLALTEMGYNVTGLDLSEDMLVIASEKAPNIEFIHRDMCELDGLIDYDLVLIAVDSLNYLKTEVEVQQTLAGANSALRIGGKLVFDVHTPTKMVDTFADYLYVENADDLTYIWHVDPGDEPLSVVHELTIFARNEHGSYLRSVEHHYQRTFEMEQYQSWLAEVGFEIIEQFGDIDRQLFVCRKM